MEMMCLTAQAVSTLLHWHPITVLLAGNAVPIGLSSVQNTGDEVAVKPCRKKLTHECVGGCLGTRRYLKGDYYSRVCLWRTGVITTVSPRINVHVLISENRLF